MCSHIHVITCCKRCTGGKKKSIPFRRQRMEMDCPPPISDVSIPHLPYSNDPYVADLLRVADDNMAKVKHESVVVMQERDGLQVKQDSYKKQVRASCHRSLQQQRWSCTQIIMANPAIFGGFVAALDGCVMNI